MANTKLDTIKNKLSAYGEDTSRALIQVPADLFNNATTTNKYGQMYLFQQFGQAKSSGLSKKSQITTHYTEANYAINDHWAVEPLTYKLSGLIGEVIYRPSTNWSNKALARIKNYTAPLSIISPTFDSYTQSAINLTNQVEEVYKRYVQTAKKAIRSAGLSDSISTSNQEFVFNQLNTLVDNRQFVTIYTPYGTYDNMAIIDVQINQDDTLYMSKLDITLQQWRDTESSSRSATKAEKAELARVQGALASQNGIASTSEVETNSNSTLKNMVDSGKSLLGFN